MQFYEYVHIFSSLSPILRCNAKFPVWRFSIIMRVQSLNLFFRTLWVSGFVGFVLIKNPYYVAHNVFPLSSSLLLHQRQPKWFINIYVYYTLRIIILYRLVFNTKTIQRDNDSNGYNNNNNNTIYFPPIPVYRKLYQK